MIKILYIVEKNYNNNQITQVYFISISDPILKGVFSLYKFKPLSNASAFYAIYPSNNFPDCKKCTIINK